MERRFSSDEIRETFLGFFTERQHARIGAASVIPANDPSLLFINAGMAPLKPYFLGEALPPAPDLCNVQPCVRTIDIGDVGDRHHMTFFEMLGSWSIDHYFKERAVELAFELLTQGFGFGAVDLYVTVFAGDEKLGIEPDEVSAAAWEQVGVPRDHIVYLGAEDNFWSAGDTGPCGPCTEVFYDTGPQHGPQYRPGGEFDSSGRYIEIWNAGVFMEFNRLPGGTLEPLRFTSVDTGSGLERMAMVLQGRDSAYETDLFAPIVAAVRVRAGRDRRGRAGRPDRRGSRPGLDVHPQRGRRPLERGPWLHPAAAAAEGDRDRDPGRRGGLRPPRRGRRGHRPDAARLPAARRRPRPHHGPARPRAARLRPGGPPRPGPARRAGRRARLRDHR